MGTAIRVTVWHEYRHEKENEVVRACYPEGMHVVMREAIEEQLGGDVAVRTATLDEPEHGLSAAVLADTDVLTWWGHKAHSEVSDEIVERVQQRVLEGMGLIVLHSGHYAKVFQKLMGTTCSLKWREVGERERLWVVNPGHPITDGLEDHFEVPQAEMYGELFDIPEPDELVFISWFEGGEVFRSGCTWRRGKGKVFYFRPGHETYPIYRQAEVRKVLGNAVRWAAPAKGSPYTLDAKNMKEPLSPIGKG
ncbi:MAG: ThuA domain-containing protein [Phycisphaeraceae bacterium]